uniref:Uncharacterized protein n=1 Tax=Anabas testudineus TaxID=64144 RepID=A0A7N6FG63_ANATE
MLPVKTVTPLQTSKQTSAAASKIKNKILNTSSFFKVSLKTNNKALALALEAQKERSRQLEREIVNLQKQVEALCFELATRKYKDRKLVCLLYFMYLEKTCCAEETCLSVVSVAIVPNELTCKTAV